MNLTENSLAIKKKKKEVTLFQWHSLLLWFLSCAYLVPWPKLGWLGFFLSFLFILYLFFLFLISSLPQGQCNLWKWDCPFRCLHHVTEDTAEKGSRCDADNIRSLNSLFQTCISKTLFEVTLMLFWFTVLTNSSFSVSSDLQASHIN